MTFRDRLSLYSIKPQNDPKCKVEKRDISLTFLYYKKTRDSISLSYAITIFKYRDMNGQILTELGKKDVDMNSLRKAVMDQLIEADRKYFDINSIDTRKVEFVLKEKWFEDAMKNITLFKQISIFKKDFRLKTAPPLLIRTTCVNTKSWNDIIVSKVKKYITDTSLKKHFTILSVAKRLLSFSTYFDMFDWSYSSVYNVLEGSMKAKWVALVLFGASKIIQKDKYGDNI